MFMLVFCIWVDCVGAGGCSSRTHLAWLSEHSQGGVWGQGATHRVCRPVALRVHCSFRSWGHSGALGSASVVFIGFAVLSDGDEVRWGDDEGQRDHQQ